MSIPFRPHAALGIALALCAAAAAPLATAKTLNPGSEKLASMPPAQRDAALAGMVGHWCIGSEATLMGTTEAGAGEGNAYWSVRCAGGGAWVVQIDPLGGFVAIDCDTFKQNAPGKECFKKF